MRFFSKAFLRPFSLLIEVVLRWGADSRKSHGDLLELLLVVGVLGVAIVAAWLASLLWAPYVVNVPLRWTILVLAALIFYCGGVATLTR